METNQFPWAPAIAGVTVFLILPALWLREWLTLRKIPAPKPGQIWRSQHSGRCIKITSVETTDLGTMTYDYAHETAPGQFNIISMTGYDLDNWRRKVRDEARVLDNPTPRKAHEPPRPLPPPAQPARNP